ncbi:MAG: FAD binding domain-containing protein [bacterium]
MLKEVVEFYAPRELEEAHGLLLKHYPHAQLVGGGLDLTWRERKEARYLIGLDHLPLKFIKSEEGTLEVGAMVTIRELLENEALENVAPDSLKPALKAIATPLLRGVITVGGSLARAYPWSDLPALFLGLESKIGIFDGKYRVFELREFYEGDFREVLRRALITKVLIPQSKGRYFSYRRFTRTEVDIPLLNQAVSLHFREGKIGHARIFLGARPGFPLELEEIEGLLEGKELSEGVIGEACAMLRESAPVESDFRISKEFRKHLAGVLLEENLREIKGKYESSIQA